MDGIGRKVSAAFIWHFGAASGDFLGRYVLTLQWVGMIQVEVTLQWEKWVCTCHYKGSKCMTLHKVHTCSIAISSPLRAHSPVPPTLPLRGCPREPGLRPPGALGEEAPGVRRPSVASNDTACEVLCEVPRELGRDRGAGGVGRGVGMRSEGHMSSGIMLRSMVPGAMVRV